MEQYTYPIYKEIEIAESINALFGPDTVTEQAIRNPDPQILSHIYEVFLTSLRVNLDSLRQPHWYASENLDCPEAFDDAIPVVTFASFMKTIMAKIGFEDFSIRDITEPKPKRIRKILSGLINLRRFSEQAEKAFDETTVQRKQLEEDSEQATLRNEELRKKLNDHKKRKAEDEPSLKELKEEIATMNASMSELRSKKVDMGKEHNDLKEEETDLNKINDDLRIKIDEVKRGKESLSQLIIKSPKRILDEVEQAERRLAGLQLDKVNHDKRLQELKAHVGFLETMKLELEHMDTMMVDIGEELTKKRELKEELQKIFVRKQILTSKAGDLKNSLTHLRKVMESREESCKSTDVHYQSKMATLTCQKKTLQLEIEQIEQGVSEDDVADQDFRDRVANVEKEIEKLQEEYHTEVREMQEMMDDISKLIDEHNSERAKEIEILHKALDEKLKASNAAMNNEDGSVFGSSVINQSVIEPVDQGPTVIETSLLKISSLKLSDRDPIKRLIFDSELSDSEKSCGMDKYSNFGTIEVEQSNGELLGEEPSVGETLGMEVTSNKSA